MKPLFDLTQIALSLPGPLGFLASAALVVVILQLCKSFGEALGAARLLLKWLWERVVFVRTGKQKAQGRKTSFVWAASLTCLAAMPVYLTRFALIDRLQYAEQVFAPAYISGDTSAHALALYEAALDVYCDKHEAEVVRRRTREIAGRIGCSPLALYEVAYSECGNSKTKGINPFAIRKDSIAAGYIQFTRAGLGFVPGVTLPQVKQACKNRDVEKIMEWTETYLVRAASGRQIADAAGVYVAVFAPGFVGADDAQVLYSAARDGDRYYLNAGFDGYYLDAQGRIIRRDAAKDGRITVGELRLHLEAKKARFLKSKI